jgi:hypothetical protein
MKLVPLREGSPATIRFGLMRGKIRIAPSFDEPLPDEMLQAFEVRGEGSSRAVRDP